MKKRNILIINKFTNKDNSTINENDGSDNSNTIKTVTKVFKDFTFEIPSDMLYSAQDDFRLLLKTSDWYAQIEPYADPYGYMLDYPNCTKKRFSNLGYPVGEIKKNEGEEKKYIIFTLDDGNEKDIISFYKYNSSFTFYIALVNNDNSYNDDALETIYKIISNAKYESTNTNTYKQYLSDMYYQCHEVEGID